MRVRERGGGVKGVLEGEGGGGCVRGGRGGDAWKVC